jgi:hypothetical protein
MDFTEAEKQRMQLNIRLKKGQISPASYASAVNALRVTDTTGKIWQPDPAGSGWLYWNGSAWQPAVPPLAQAPERSKDFREFKSSLMTVDEFRKVSKEVPLAKRPQKWWDLLSILGGIAAAVLWFLYGGIRSGREGFDLITPLLMIGIPVMLVWFRKDIDMILLPLQPQRKKISRIILIGLGIAAPFLTAWILYNIFFISQYPLMQANIILGTMVSYAIVRDPVPASSPVHRQRPLTPAGIGIIFCVFLISLSAPPVLADDCASDPFNAQDCLRTNGFAETMAGAAAAGLGVLINGPIILQGILAGGSAAGSSGTIYGTGRPKDPYRDGNTLGEVGPDGKITPYPENAGQPPKIYGTGTRNDPYRDYPDADNPPWKAPFGDGSVQNPYSDTAPPVFDHSPTPPDAPVQPPVTPPTSPQSPGRPRSPVGPQGPPVPPVQPPVPPVQPPVPPVQPPVPPVQPPVPPKPKPLTPAQRQELITQRGRLWQEVLDLQAKWKRKKWLANIGVPRAFTLRTKHLIRAGGKATIKTVQVVTDPKGALWDGAKEKMGVKTPLDKIKEKTFGKEVPMPEIVKEAEEADRIWRELDNELKAMPSDEQMISELHKLNGKIATIDGKLAGGS